MAGHVTRARFTDFGQWREHLRCWDTEAIQLSPGPLSIKFDVATADDLQISRLRFDRAAVLRSTTDKDWHAPVVHVTPKRWCGVELAPGSIVTLPPLRETDAVSHAPWESIAINVRQDTLLTWPPPLARLAERNPSPEDSILAVRPEGASTFRTWIQTLLATAPEFVEGERETWTAALHDQLQTQLLAVLGHQPDLEPVSSLRRVARYDLVLHSLRIIERETERRLEVRDLAEGAGVSVRSVEYAFRSVLGTSPARYILAQRLNKVRHHLMTYGVSGQSVTDAAFEHQFENLGRFAQQYTKLFGERPSDTLRAARAALQSASGS